MHQNPKAPLKYRLIDLLRATRILEFADWSKYWLHRATMTPANRAFERAHPDFALPPPDLSFDAYNCVDWATYERSGRLHAGIFADIVSERFPAGALSILEWGCGPGRLIRHWQDLLQDYELRLTGADYNPRTIDWCKEHLSDIRFVQNELMPPLLIEDEEFDVAYCFSVFTHLSADSQRAWSRELLRVLKPGGLLICTTHGDRCRHLLTSQEDVRRYDAGEVVIKGKYVEGKKWYLAIHPERFVEDDLLRDYRDVGRIEVGDDKQMKQDVWVASKPARSNLSPESD